MTPTTSQHMARWIPLGSWRAARRRRGGLGEPARHGDVRCHQGAVTWTRVGARGRLLVLPGEVSMGVPGPEDAKRGAGCRRGKGSIIHARCAPRLLWRCEEGMVDMT